MSEIPKPPQSQKHGYLWLPPYRVQGYSVAGEATTIHVPELNLGFDMGVCPKYALNNDYIALSHGHMDHVASIAYYFSQRRFQGMGVGKVFCPKKLERPLRELMKAWVAVEHQKTEYEIIGMEPGGENDDYQLRNDLKLRCFKTKHRVPSLGYVAIETRNKLVPELQGKEQFEIVQAKKEGKQITYEQQIPLVAYFGDTAPGEHFDRNDIQNAKIVIIECTFSGDDEKGRAKAGAHMHVDDLVKVLPKLKAEHVIINHVSRRIHFKQSRDNILAKLPTSEKDRVLFLHDHFANKRRYQEQLEASD